MANDTLSHSLPEPAPPLLAWTETLVITMLPPLMGWWLHREDPLFITSDFPWLVLAPVLPALRFGFVHGFISALLLVGLMVLGWETGRLPLETFPDEVAVGMLILAMLTGEFTDMHHRRLQQQQVINAHQRTRLDEFTRNYHLLKVSHDRLEQRLAAGTHSLRGALLDLRRQLTLPTERPSDPLTAVSDRILALFAGFGWIRVAGLYAVHRHHIAPHPIARIGAMQPVDPFDPLIRHAVNDGSLVSIGDQALETSKRPRSQVLVAVPLVDVNEKVWGVLAVQELPFIALHEENLRLLAVLGGHIGDLLAGAASLQSGESMEAGDFRYHLAQALRDRRKYGLPAMVLVLRFPRDHSRWQEMMELFLGQVRGLDHPWRMQGEEKNHLLFLLMPLTGEAEADAYRRRMDRVLHERFGAGFNDLGIEMRRLPLQGKDSLVELLERLHELAGIHPAADPAAR